MEADLRTARLVLRLPDPRYAADIALLANDRRIATMLARLPNPYGYEDGLGWIAHAHELARTGRGFSLAIHLNQKPYPFIGACGVGPLGADPVPHLGYWIGVPYWSKGYALEAAACALACGFEELRLLAIQSGAQQSNPASRTILEKLGFHASSRGRDEMIDAFWLTREEWLAR
jgi:RimJ/RimL family protein N-acetyltransferase